MDMWVTGYTPEYAVSLWYGYTEAERGYYLGNDGYSTRGRLFRQIISSISDTSGAKRFAVPGSVVKATIEKETSPSLLPSANTPGDMRVTEYFKRGTQPTEVSPRFNQLPNPSGLTVKESGSNVVLSWNATAKPSYLTDDALRKSLQGLYGKKTEEALASRKASYGEFGYEVLAMNSKSGATTSLGFTTSSSFTTKKPSSTTVYYVKTTWQNMSYTASSGISSEFKVAEPTVLLTTELVNDSSSTYTVGSTYTDPGIKVYNNGVDVTSKANISVSSSFGTKGQKESYTLTEAGSVTFKYTVSYDGATATNSRTITVKANEGE